MKSLSEQSKYISSLHDEHSFYKYFIKDLTKAKREIIIESPFITVERAEMILPVFLKLVRKNVKVFVVTRNPIEHNEILKIQSEQIISNFESEGIQVLLCTGNHHRKLAILDRSILWEGSLNILSQTNSREIMRRIEGDEFALEMINFLNFNKFL